MTPTLQQRRQQLLDGTGPSPTPLPPPPKRNDPSIPTVYDPQWQFYVDLSQEQIAAYQAMPEWAIYVATQPEINYGGDAAATSEARAAIAAKAMLVSP